MEFLKALTGSLFWAFLLSLLLYLASSYAITFLSKKSKLLEPIGDGLNLIALFLALQVFLHLGASEYYPRLSQQINFLSWLIFAFAALRLGLYVYGDLFVVRWKRGSFPAAFKNIIIFFVIIIVALVLLKEILDINITSLIATTTVLTATIGLAFQSTLANMLAGLSIHLEKSLNQGDWISAGGHEGRVMDISLRSTRIMTIEHNEVYIPNSKVLSEAVVNFSLPSTVQVRKLTVSVSYDVPPNKVRQAVRDILTAVPDVSAYPEPVVRVAHFGDFSVQYELRYTITDHARCIDIETEIMNLVWYRFKRNNIEIPMPIRHINMKQVTPETRQAEKDQLAAELVALMQRVVILSPLSKAELARLVDQVRVEPYAMGEVPIRQGDAGDSFYIIKSGRVDVAVARASGETAIVASLGPGNFFGEMSLLTGAARTASILVKEDAEFIVIDKESFGATLARNPSIAESLSHILAERQAGLSAEHERLDSASLERRKRDASGRMLSKIREFFGLGL
ncbi:MAG TPA: mechanosensitive ion channel family protein [Nitrospirota bacterium]|nr:mechanosensitive ion channel family protein [Nitrospirota bacterium]